MRVALMLLISLPLFGGSVVCCGQQMAVAAPFIPPYESHKHQVASQLIFEFHGRKWQIDLIELGFDGVDPTTVDRASLQKQVDAIIKGVERYPQNATFHRRKMIPHQNGWRVEREKLKHIIAHIVSNQNKVLTLPVIEIEPEITTASLSRITEKVLGRYTTTFNPHNAPRVTNIDLSSQAIDYEIVPPGETFSFNETVGPRTYERGYRPAPIIVRGEYSEGVGGGICQTSSTLFNSADQAGLPIIERAIHSKRVTYVPKGRDATVSWGGPDFKFKNDTNYPILIASEMHHGWITVTIYGERNIPTKRKKVPPPPKGEPEQIPSTTKNGIGPNNQGERPRMPHPVII